MKQADIFQNLFIFEMANNHMGDPARGKRIIQSLAKVSQDFSRSDGNGSHFRFGFKLQYRQLDTFIHPDYRNRDDIKYVKRFRSTELKPDDMKELKEEAARCGLVTVCTPFDEPSVAQIEEHDYDIIKIGSCSLTDWPLLERIVQTDKPIIASTAGASLDDIDRVVSFFEHRKKTFALMHCIGLYPTPDEDLQLNQIDVLKARYPHIPIGYSTHEQPDNLDAVRMAVAKGAVLFEKHVGLRDSDNKLNAYSADPQQVCDWLDAARQAYAMCGVTQGRYTVSAAEKQVLHSLRRGAFAGRDIKKGERIVLKDIFAAIPTQSEQLTMNDMSKYIEYYAREDIGRNQPLLHSNTDKVDNVERVKAIIEQVKQVLKESHVLVPRVLELEISHHYGIERFNEIGATIVNLLNREYCMKLIVLVPGQKHPEQYHKKKVETFRILYGDVLIESEGLRQTCQPGDFMTIEQGRKHIFSSPTGAVIEEISTTYDQNDSYYTDETIMANPGRKTYMTVWLGAS